MYKSDRYPKAAKVMLGILTSAALAGCTSHDAVLQSPPSTQAKGILSKPVHGCDQRAGRGSLALPLSERGLPWIRATTKVGQLTLTYYEDCSLDVRGPVTTEFPQGALLQDYSCVDSALYGLFSDPADTRFNQGLDVTLTATAHDFDAQLKAQDICGHDGKIEPDSVHVTSVAPLYTS